MVLDKFIYNYIEKKLEEIILIVNFKQQLQKIKMQKQKKINLKTKQPVRNYLYATERKQ